MSQRQKAMAAVKQALSQSMTAHKKTTIDILVRVSRSIILYVATF